MKAFLLLLAALLFTACSDDTTGGTISTTPPATTVKLVFIHHSCGANWLAAGDGGLAVALNANNYFVNDTDYGWDAEPEDNLGDRTDTGNWPEWFTAVKMTHVHAKNGAIANTLTNPGGENTIIMFKSCYPLSEVGDSIADEQAIYSSLLTYFATNTHKLFILITPPGEETVDSHALTRQLCTWLVDEENGWLKDYPHKNVAVFDFYCVLSETGSHHRVQNGSIQHVYAADYDGNSPYHDSNDHPNSTGNTKATSEYLPLLNHFYNRWQASL